MKLFRLAIISALFISITACDPPHPSVIVTDVVKIDADVNQAARMIITMKNHADVSAYDINGLVGLELNGEVIEQSMFYSSRLHPGESLIRTVEFVTIADHQSYDRYFIDLTWYDQFDDRYHAVY